ncbi:MAG: hypothetical protein CVV24_13105 [Ignavibacteriae bacterium HGW-Ignavibacteriae-3]|nr:MAG: hypothetical protein CVV24_13105 [Ignavibacteriae bacterium HGW-Ignavibacteriae-3]
MKKNKPSLPKQLSKDEKKFFQQFKTPFEIQIYLNNADYNPEYLTFSPRLVMHRHMANCFEGALFAAAVLRMLGHKPLIVDLMADNDDDHVLAIFKQNNLFGAVAKSNTTLLRYREPVYRSIRELVMSYFDFYINTDGDKTLRSYSNPVNLSKFDKYNWMTTDKDLEFIGDYLFTIKHYNILNTKSIRGLSPSDNDILEICFRGSVPEGLFVPLKNKNK